MHSYSRFFKIIIGMCYCYMHAKDRHYNYTLASYYSSSVLFTGIVNKFPSDVDKLIYFSVFCFANTNVVDFSL